MSSTTQEKIFNSGPLLRTQLSNGAVLLHQKDKHHFGSHILFTFLVGSRDEKEDEEGLCHLLEHLFFKADGVNFSHPLVKKIEDLGGDINAYTTKETLSIQVFCHFKKTTDILQHMLEMVFSPVFLEKAFSAEKKVIVQELREDLDDIDVYAGEALFKSLYPQDLGHSIGGTISRFKKIPYEKLIKFYKKFITPQRLLISVVSKTSETKLINTVENFFDKTKNHQPVRRAKDVFYKIPKINKTYKRYCQSSIVLYALSGVSYAGQLTPAYVVMDYYLAYGLGSRFYQRLRYENAFAYGILTDLCQFTDKGHYEVNITCSPKNVKPVITILNEEIEALASAPLKNATLSNIKKHLAEVYDVALDLPEDQLNFMTKLELFKGKFQSVEKHKKNYTNVSAEDVMNLAQRLLSHGPSTVSVIPL